MKKDATPNKELDLAWNFVNKTDKNIFLTGKAGTGKTTFLHKIKETTLKRHVVVAPTGVAAINARGTTIHSFFQMPFGPILPSNEHGGTSEALKQRKFNKKKIDIIRSLDLLIIDEISMVRADLLDGIDQVLRKYKDRTKVFGGVQVLMIGDLQQLAPVVKDGEWNLLRQYYETVYFFSSKAFRESQAIGIELKYIYRQQNQIFIDILNEIRNNRISQDSIDRLNERYIPGFIPEDKEGYITLTTHNNQANEINKNKIDAIDSDSCFFEASVEGDFSEHNFPTQENLELKVGAQVMFVKNDSSIEKRYFNGKIGKIVSIEKEKVIVRCNEDYEDIETTTELWENIVYKIDSETKEIKEEVKGSFEQIPLRLAWAITIHKSQGLTFEKAVIDIKSSFAHGQTYVALSRCKTLEGMVLRSPIEHQSIIHDNTVTVFTKNIEDNQPDKNDLAVARKLYHLSLIAELFDFTHFHYPIYRALQISYQNQNTLRGNYLENIKIIKEEGVDNLIKVGTSFKKQLEGLSKNLNDPLKDDGIQERISKGMVYFSDQIETFIDKPLDDLTFSTDNKAVKKELQEQIKRFNELLKLKEFCFKGLNGRFNAHRYMELRNDAVFAKVKEPKALKNEVESSVNKKLFNQLRDFRTSIANSQDIPPYQVFTQDTLHNICNDLPVTPQQLRKIKGMGKVRVSNYGDEIIEIIKDYCKDENVDLSTTISSSKSDKESNSKVKIGNTKQISFDLYKSGFSVSEIAKKRGLTVGTIETHLSTFVSEGLITLSELLGEKKSKEILSAIKSVDYKTLELSQLKHKLDDKYSWGELRIALHSFEKDDNS